MLDGGDVLGGERTVENVDLRVAHLGALALRDELDALACARGALIELPRQRLDAKHDRTRRFGQDAIGRVRLRFAEHGGNALLEQLVRNALDVVAVQQTQRFQILDEQDVAQFAKQLLGLHVEASLLFHVNPGYHAHTLSPSIPTPLLYPLTCVRKGWRAFLRFISTNVAACRGHGAVQRMGATTS